MRKIIRIAKRFKTNIKKTTDRIFNSFVFYYFRKPVDPKRMLFTSRNGDDIAGNMLRLMIEAQNRDPNNVIGIAATKAKRKHIKSVLENYGLTRIKIIKYDSIRYYKWIEVSKYLFCDSTLPRRFIKKSDQIYINTWHGTPLKRMGNDSKSDRYDVANVQKNILSTDVFVCPSDYYKERMLKAYDVQDIYGGNVSCLGYPRNSILYDEESRENVRKKYGLQDKNVYIYMPTYRESMGVKQNEHQAMQINSFLKTIDDGLNEDEVLFVKLHVFNAERIDLSGFKRIRKFPGDIETYEFMNISDALISDYSSVMYDYANTRNLIVRFVYDEEAYYDSRGMYEQPVEMPFPKVYDAGQLVDTIRAGKEYDDTEFIETYCKYDNLNATREVLDLAMSFDSDLHVPENEGIHYYYNEEIRDNIISDNLRKIIDDNPDERAFLVFSKQALRRNPGNYENLLDNIDGVLGINNTYYKSILETVAYVLLHKYGIYNDWIKRKLDQHYYREVRRFFAGYPITNYVYYQGRNINTADLLSNAEAKSTLYVYYYWMDRYNKSVLKRLFMNYDELIACDQEIVGKIQDIMGEDYDETKVFVNRYYL